MTLQGEKYRFRINRHFFFLTIVFVFGFSLNSFAEISLTDSNSDDISSSTDRFEEPFLITKTSRKYREPAEKVYSAIRSKLKSGQITNIQQNYQLPQDFFEETQLEALQKCNQEKCLMKLNTTLEVPLLKASKNKVAKFQELIANRIKGYADSKQLLGYDERKSNVGYFKKMIALLPTLEKSPGTQQYLKTDFWRGDKKSNQLADSWFRHEMVNIAPDQMQPILRVSENTEYKEGNRTLFLEIHIYSNHYFDSSLSLYEVIADKKKPNETEVVVTDIMEIDELKKTALIRAMFTGKMVKAVTTYQTQFLENLFQINRKK